MLLNPFRGPKNSSREPASDVCRTRISVPKTFLNLILLSPLLLVGLSPQKAHGKDKAQPHKVVFSGVSVAQKSDLKKTVPSQLKKKNTNGGKKTSPLEESFPREIERLKIASSGMSLAAELSCEKQEELLSKGKGVPLSLGPEIKEKILKQGVNPKALEAALQRLKSIEKKNWIKKDHVFVLIDYTKASPSKRFHVIEWGEDEVQVTSFKTAHGKGSDPDHDGKMNCFSPREGSRGTPRGASVTGGIYHGEHGYSLRLHGLEKENQNNCARAIVIHPAKYVNWKGQTGRSWGCPSLDTRISKKLIDHIKGGAYLYAYGNQPLCK